MGSCSMACTAAELHAFVQREWNCPADRFGFDCSQRFSSTREYLPHQLGGVLHSSAACASLWYHSWLCGRTMPVVEADLRDITVGKTLLRRILYTYIATLDQHDTSCRIGFEKSALAMWAWLPQDRCHDDGGREISWMLRDACDQPVPSRNATSPAFMREGSGLLRRAAQRSAQTGGRDLDSRCHLNPEAELTLSPYRRALVGDGKDQQRIALVGGAGLCTRTRERWPVRTSEGRWARLWHNRTA